MYKVTWCFLLILHLLPAFSQQTVQQLSIDKLYFDGMVLYNEKDYHASALLLEEYQDSKRPSNYLSETKFYLAMNYLRSGDNHGVAALQSFASANENHPLASVANFNLGNHAFDKKDYSEALGYYSKVAEDQLDKESLISFIFKRGYASMIKEDNDQAIRDFKQVSYYKKTFYQEAIYYLGLIYSNDNQFSEALVILKEADDNEGPYASLITELIANIYYQTDDYPQLISYASQKLSDAPTSTNRTLHRLLGETYFKKQEYRQASRHFQRHLDFSKSKMDGEGYYKLGYSYYQLKEDQKAIDNFKLAALEKGDLGQSSSFYLGKLYLKSDNYSYALSAFKNAIAEGENASMHEEASFLVGKINYSTKQYADVIAAVKAFKIDYPKSKWSIESSELLTKSYLKTSDYSQAIEYIESTETKTLVIKEAYQSVCFHKAQQLYNDSKFNESIDYFKKSLVYKIKPKTTSEAFYLIGEAYSLTNQPELAKQAFNNGRSISANTEWGILSSYGLGYLAYNQKEYEQAEAHFKSFVTITTSKNTYYGDGKMRLADCYFVQKKYDQAIKTYESLLDNASVPQDYLNYQIGVTFALSNKGEQARSSFSKVITYKGKSAYKDNALFQTGESYIGEATFLKAAEYYTQLINNYSESPLVPFCYGRRALCYSNLNQVEGARQDYEFILKNHISHEVANGALLGLQELIKKGLNIPNFETYMDAYRLANPDDGSLEVVAFESAKNKYYNQNYNNAISDLNTFLFKYPESSFGLDAQYFIADSYYRLNDWENASIQFEKLTQGENNAYTSRSLDKRGKSLLALKAYDKAIRNYRQLLKSSTNRKEQYLAREGLMNGFFDSGKLDSSLYYVNTIINDDWRPLGVDESIWLIKGKILFIKKEFSKATDELIKVVNGPLDEKSAEAKYYLASVFYAQGAYKRSLEALFDLNRNYGSYSFWIGKSFLLIADNYTALGEILQAKATLKSIIENSPETTIVTQAKEKLLSVEVDEKAVLIQDSTDLDSLNTGK
ncbi:MAG: TolA-binding protein [Cyclobacteriaceae bacterium]|jgi:TolA-binding protein